MSKWLTRALEKMSTEERVPFVPKVPKAPADRPFGTNGTIGTASDDDLSERQAMAEIEGGVPALYSAGFAKLQLTPPAGLSVERWLQAVDDAGRFLDAFGQQAQAMGWRSEDLFRHDGLVLALRGARVTKLSATMATLSDGRTFTRRS